MTDYVVDYCPSQRFVLYEGASKVYVVFQYLPLTPSLYIQTNYPSNTNQHNHSNYLF